jgi:pyrroline-5-carboxylate reductase
VGFGNLGAAMVDGILARRLLRPEQILATDASPGRVEHALRLGCRASLPSAAVLESGLLLIAVKPQAWPAVAEMLCGGMRPAEGERPAIRMPPVLSIMAGVARSTIRDGLGGRAQVVRAMPNMPASLGLAITAVAGCEELDSQEAAFVRQLLACVGELVEVPESLFHAVTAVSGSGPAYAFRLAECMEEAARSLGVPPPVARLLVSRTIRGAGALLCEEGATPARLRDAVTSRGGTTAAALEIFDRWGLQPTVADAIAAAEARSRQLADDAADAAAGVRDPQP